MRLCLMTCVCAVTLYHISASVIAQLRVEKQSFKLKKTLELKILFFRFSIIQVIFLTLGMKQSTALEITTAAYPVFKSGQTFTYFSFA